MGSYDLKHKDAAGFEVIFSGGPIADNGGAFLVKFRGTYMDQDQTEAAAMGKMRELRTRMGYS